MGRLVPDPQTGGVPVQNSPRNGLSATSWFQMSLGFTASSSCDEEILDEVCRDGNIRGASGRNGAVCRPELRQFRKSLGKSQAGMSELLGIGVETYAAGSSGLTFSVRGIRSYLILLIEEPLNVSVLQEIGLRKKEGEESKAKVSEIFGYLRDFPGVQEWEQRFLSAMDDGTLQCPQARAN